MSTRRVELASITARLLWDGRPEAGRFIPGIAHFQSGVAALRRAGHPAATGRLREIDAALTAAEDAVNRWARGLAAFAGEALADAAPQPLAWEDGVERSLRVRAGEAVRLAALIGAFDATCAASAAVTAAARERGIFNPHHARIPESARMIRRIADLGHAGGSPAGTGAARGRSGRGPRFSAGLRLFRLRRGGCGGRKDPAYVRGFSWRCRPPGWRPSKVPRACAA